MTKIYTIFFILLNFLSFGQNVDEILLMRSKKTDSLDTKLQLNNIKNEQVIYLQNARKELKYVVNEIQKLENFNNKPLQKALMKPLFEYYDAFNFKKDGKIFNSLKYGFENKDDFINYYKISELLLLSKLVDKQFSVLIEHSEKEFDTINNYINMNLKKKGISREQYENLSENDKKILEKQFE